MNDLRFAFRSFTKSPGFTAVVVLTLAIGIAATTTVFCWMQNVILNPLPGVARQHEMAVLTTSHSDSAWDTVSLPDLRDARELHEVFAGVIGSQITPACLSADERSEWIYGQIATANFFDVLGVRAILGRTFLPDEDLKPGGHPVLVLSESLWRKRFGADPAVIGRTVALNRQPFTIIGVVPAAFYGTMSGLRCDFWAPVAMHAQVANFGSMEHRSDRWLHAQVRLQPGVSPAKVQTALDTFSARLEKEYPDTNTLIRLHVQSFSQAPYGIQPVLLPALRILLVVSVGVLLIVAANVANLLLARSTSRQKEIAIRLALGAGRVRLVRQLLIESLVLATIGGLFGALLASWSVNLLGAWIPPSHLPIGLSFTLDGRTLMFTSGLTVFTGIIFGLVPALQASKPDLNSTLKAGGRSFSAGFGHQRLRQLLVVIEVALALVLLVGAALCYKSLQKSTAADYGFKPDHVLLAGLRIGMNGYNEKTGQVFYRELRQRLVNMPGVKAAALASWFPLGFEGGPSHGVEVDGSVWARGEDKNIRFAIVTPGYFDTLDIPLLAGRDFTEHDDNSTAGVAIINENMASRFWPGQDPVGRSFKDGGRPMTVIGVAKAGKYRSLNEAPRCFYYRSYLQGVWDLNLGVCVRTVADPAGFGDALRREIHQLDAGVEVWAIQPMTDYVKAAFLGPALASRLLRWLGIVALILAALGVYGVMSFMVGQRTQEFGVRIVLGANLRTLLGMVLLEGLLLAGLGILAGLALALGASQMLATVFYGVDPFDPVIFAGVPLLLAAVALLASWLPARRATQVNPIESLRAD